MPIDFLTPGEADSILSGNYQKGADNIFQSNQEEKFGMTAEDLEKCERIVPIFAIVHLPEGHELALTEEQFVQINKDGFIKASLLNPAQLKEVEDALALDYAFSEIKGTTSSNVHRCL